VRSRRAALNQAGGSSDTPASIAVSPDGQTVFVTGFFGDDDTIAYNAATGAQLWISHFNVKTGLNQAKSLVVSHDGKAVNVTGYVPAAKGSGNDYLTEAYNAATGALLWQSRYAGAASGNDQGRAVAISPDDSTVYVTGRSMGASTGYDDATIAYTAATGAARWTKRYAGAPGGYDSDDPAGVVISPDGGTVYVTGTSETETTEVDFATLAYSAATGAQKWVSRYDDPQHGFDGWLRELPERRRQRAVAAAVERADLAAGRHPGDRLRWPAFGRLGADCPQRLGGRQRRPDQAGRPQDPDLCLERQSVENVLTVMRCHTGLALVNG
jgi:DNA-binding beta-propeller fold protein YncE